MVVVVFTMGCATPTTPVDWERLEAAGRVVEKPAGMDVLLGDKPFRWTDGTVPLELAAMPNILRRGVRLSTWISGEGEWETPFILDTGSVGTLLGARSMLASEAKISRMPFNAVGPVGAKGYMGHVPLMRMGALEARDVGVAIVTSSDLAESEHNILGILHLWHTQIEHLGGRCTLRNGADRLPLTEAGWNVVKFRSGTPIVEVRNPDGGMVNALVDTGAFATVAVNGARAGTWTLLAEDGSIAHRMEVRKTLRHTGSMGGFPFDLMIGMDVLRSRHWRMTFDESTWAFKPTR